MAGSEVGGVLGDDNRRQCRKGGGIGYGSVQEKEGGIEVGKGFVPHLDVSSAGGQRGSG